MSQITDEQIIDLVVCHSNHKENSEARDGSGIIEYEVISHARIIEFSRALLALSAPPAPAPIEADAVNAVIERCAEAIRVKAVELASGLDGELWVAAVLEREVLALRAPAPAARMEAEREEGVVYVEVSGLTGTGKSAVMGEIEIALRSLGLEVEHDGEFQSEKNMTHADWQTALDLYKPKVKLRERNAFSRAALSDGGRDG